MKKITVLFFLSISMAACSNNKNLAQSSPASYKDTLVTIINNSTTNEETTDMQLRKLQKDNELVIAFATLNFAWTRTGTYYVLANHNHTWSAYVYKAKLQPAQNDNETEVTPVVLPADSVDRILKLYKASKLWTTAGDTDDSFCNGKGNCNINDAETWTLSIGTPQNMHTTTYYAPQFFEQCCPGNLHRSQFIKIAEALQKVAGQQVGAEK